MKVYKHKSNLMTKTMRIISILVLLGLVMGISYLFGFFSKGLYLEYYYGEPDFDCRCYKEKDGSCESYKFFLN